MSNSIKEDTEKVGSWSGWPLACIVIQKFFWKRLHGCLSAKIYTTSGILPLASILLQDSVLLKDSHVDQQQSNVIGVESCVWAKNYSKKRHASVTYLKSWHLQRPKYIFSQIFTLPGRTIIFCQSSPSLAPKIFLHLHKIHGCLCVDLLYPGSDFCPCSILTACCHLADV